MIEDFGRQSTGPSKALLRKMVKPHDAQLVKARYYAPKSLTVINSAYKAVRCRRALFDDEM
jgi:hypothetical protein